MTSPADSSSSQPHCFEHEAMATTFALRIYHQNARYARQAAMEAFRLCDRLEEELSRFIESSSICRLNGALQNEEIPVGAETYVCLRQALRIAEVTGGAFDVGFRSRGSLGCREYAPPVILSESSVSAFPTRDHPDLDLGGIGKGHAVDRMAELLREWNIENALVMGGWSTLLAVGTPPGKPGWPVTMKELSDTEHFLPPGWSSSASGFSVQEDHVHDPLTGEKASHALRSWAFARSAAVSDALSTTALVLPPGQLEELVDSFPDIGLALQFSNAAPVFLGRALLTPPEDPE